MSKNLKQNLDQAMNADYGDDYQARHDAIKAAKRALFNDMHDVQKEAIMAICEANRSILQCYHDMHHPSFDDVVNLDGAFWKLLNAFEVVKDE